MLKKLFRGLRRDEAPIDSLANSWRDARNIVINKSFQAISNENGLDDITPVNFPANPISVIGVIPTNTRKVFFFVGLNPGDSEIGYIDENNIYTTVLKDAILNFSSANPIQGVFEYKFNGNLVIAWTDSTNGKFNPNRILNIDCPAFEIDGSFAAVDPVKAAALIKLFPDVKSPLIDDINLLEGGGGLLTGVYYPIISYELADKSVTSWISFYNPISIILDNSSLPFYEIGGIDAEVPTSKLLEIDFTDVDTNYQYLRFGVVYKANGQLTPYFVNKFPITGSTLKVVFSNTENTKEAISLDEVLIPNAIYPYSKSMTTLQNKLYLGNIEKDEELEYQDKAMNIGIEWVREKDINLWDTTNTKPDGGFKGEDFIFFNKEFKYDEVYAFYIAFRNKTSGLWSRGFHIPGRTSVPADLVDIEPTDAEVSAVSSGNPVPTFQIYETAVPTSTTGAVGNKDIIGDMGYWENENEVYPSNPLFGANQGLPVRHHKFPGLDLIVRNGGAHTIDNKLVYAKYSAHNTHTTSYHSLEFLNFTNTLSSGYGSALAGASILSGLPTIQNQLNWTVDTKKKLYFKGYVKVDVSVFGGANVVGKVNLIDHDTTGYNIRTQDFGVQAGAFTAEFEFAGRIGEFTSYAEIEVILENTMGVGGFTITTVDAETYLKIFDIDESYVTSKLLGIRVSGVYSDASITDKYDSWGIFYAKRTSSNIRALGQDFMKLGRLHQFDLVGKQAALTGSYLKTQLRYSRNPYLAGTYEETCHINLFGDFQYLHTVANRIFDIQDWALVGEGTSTPYNNTNSATSLYVTAGATLGTPYDLTQLSDIIQTKNFMLELMIYKKDMYLGFQDQDLIFTGYEFKLTGSNPEPTQKAYGGDVFNNYHGFIDNLTTFEEFLIPCQSAANIGFRQDDLLTGKYYYPKHFGFQTNKPTVSFYDYNEDYSSLNDLQKVFPARYSDKDCLGIISTFPTGIAYSIVSSGQTESLSWRIFKLNDFFSMPKNKGVIWNILGSDRTLFIHHEDTLFIATIKDRLNVDGQETYLGVSDIFDRPPQEVLPINEGFAGTRSQFACIVTKQGYCFVDRKQGKVFIYTSKGLDEISNRGLFHFWKDNSEQQFPDIDNPFARQGYTMSYDNENERLIVVKQDINFASPNGFKSFCLSYSFKVDEGRGGWVSFHDYLPHYIFSNRDGVYLVDLNLFTKLYKHNSQVNKGKYLNLNMGNQIITRCYIDVPFNNDAEITKDFQNVKWLTEVIDNIGVKKENKTITHLAIFNNNQCSGLITLFNDSRWYGKAPRNVEELWQFNNFRDLLKDRDLPFIDQTIQNFGSILISNITNKSWYDKSKFISKFAIVRFEYDNLDQNDINIIAVGTNVKPSTR